MWSRPDQNNIFGQSSTHFHSFIITLWWLDARLFELSSICNRTESFFLSSLSFIDSESKLSKTFEAGGAGGRDFCGPQKHCDEQIQDQLKIVGDTWTGKLGVAGDVGVAAWICGCCWTLIISLKFLTFSL